LQPDVIFYLVQATQSRHLWVGGISSNVSKEQIEGEFRKYGVLEDFKLLRERNCAFVDYVKIEDAVNAVEALNRTRIGDEELRVDYGRSQPDRLTILKKIHMLVVSHTVLVLVFSWFAEICTCSVTSIIEGSNFHCIAILHKLSL
jgi:RNA recognition motif-containing protein